MTISDHRREGPPACLLALLLFACSSPPAEGPGHPTDEVLPLVGTGGSGFQVGALPAGVALPFGMVRPGPDTSTNGEAPGFAHCGGYWYEDSEIRGFSQLHVAGTGVPDYGLVMLMPAVDLAPGPLDESVWRQDLEHGRERSAVGSYRVELLPSHVVVELSATPHTAVYELTYPAGRAADLVLDLGHGLGEGKTRSSEIHVDPARREVRGTLLHEGALAGPELYRVYFVLRFDRDVTATETWDGQDRTTGTDRTGTAVGAVLHFGTIPADPSGVNDSSRSAALREASGPVHIQVGVSFVDVESAAANLEAEWVGFDLGRAKAAARAAWDEALGVVEIEGGTKAYRQRFYTALYDAHLMPTLFTDTDGRYRGLDGDVHTADGFTYFTDLSFWDTFRTFHPLMTLLRPDRARDFVRTIESMTEQSGRVPKWPLATVETSSMIDRHGETVWADSLLDGIEPGDAEATYARLRAMSLPGLESPVKMDCFEPYVALGYCPRDHESGSVSKTLENAFSDFVLAKVADRLGHAEDAAIFGARARSWQNVIGPSGLAEGRAADGTFLPDFQEDLFSDDFVEGNARQWTVFVPHDVAGLAEKVGHAKLLDFLTRLFEGTASSEESPVLPDVWYWHGNEPDIHAAYLFAELGRWDLTSRWVRWIVDHRYDDTPAGLAGNDDGGTLSAWYVFSALGLYPKIAEGRYVLGAPLFPKATLHLAGGKAFVIRAEGWSERAIYVRRASLNGTPLDTPFVSHADVVRGGELVFELSED